MFQDLPSNKVAVAVRIQQPNHLARVPPLCHGSVYCQLSDLSEGSAEHWQEAAGNFIRNKLALLSGLREFKSSKLKILVPQ